MAGTISILGTNAIEIYPDPFGNYPPECIVRKHVTAIIPVPYQQKQSGDDQWTYPFNSITKILVYYKHGKKQQHVDIELQTISNHPEWNDGSLLAFQAAVSDINIWLNNGTVAPTYLRPMLADGSIVYSVMGLDYAEFPAHLHHPLHLKLREKDCPQRRGM